MFLRRPLLLRISPNPFAFVPIPSMSLSSRNRSISKAFCHILPCIAQVCEGMHYHKTGVPWQMKSTFIINLNSLKTLSFYFSKTQSKSLNDLQLSWDISSWYSVLLINKSSLISLTHALSNSCFIKEYTNFSLSLIS